MLLACAKSTRTRAEVVPRKLKQEEQFKVAGATCCWEAYFARNSKAREQSVLELIPIFTDHQIS